MSTLINATLAAIVYLYYIGPKPEKRDTITDTQITWFGFGDKQAVPAAQAAVLLRHRDVWVTEDEFKKGVEEGRYKPLELVNIAPDLPDDIDLDGMDDEPADELDDGAESEGDAAVIAKIQEYILSIETEKKPKIDTVRAALPELKITAADLTKAWKELGASDDDIEV